MGAPDPLDDWEARFRDREKRALARALSWVENADPRGAALTQRLRDLPEDAWVIGVTGPPGVGKSSLVDQLAHRFLEEGRRVAVLAVDPSSPFSGGAVLGDRIRMHRSATHPNAFVRSTGTRGALGGLARTTPGILRMLALFGHDVVIVETVGVGQSEVEIVGEADTSVVLEAPGLGDSVQAIKAGILEIGDLFVVNKADRPGANRAALEIESMLSLAPQGRGWDPPVLLTSSTKGEGFEELVTALERHRGWLGDGGRLEDLRARRRLSHFTKALTANLRGQAEAYLREVGADLMAAVEAGEVAPEQAATRVRPSFELSQGGEDA